MMHAVVAAMAWNERIGGNVQPYIQYLQRYGKNYADTPAFWSHYYNYEQNQRAIDAHNRGNASWTMAANNFTDLTRAEFRSIYLGARRPATERGSAPAAARSAPQPALPSAIDWRSEGIVTDVKDQGSCGSCWAFSAVGSLEGAHARKSRTLTALSEQNLVDCAGPFGCDGCGGGWMTSAFEYVESNGGIDTEAAYAYRARDERCAYRNSSRGATVRGVVNITQGDTDALLRAVATVGPVSVAIDASFDLQMYGSGVYTSTSCSKTMLNHGVLVVGYGETSTGKKYYIIKNSWGKDWGMDGYVYFDRDVPNMCGIAEAASYPLV